MTCCHSNPHKRPSAKTDGKNSQWVNNNNNNNESKNRRKNLAMAWINYKKAYDMVPQSWIINWLKMYKISHDIINFIKKKHEQQESWINSMKKKLGWNKDPKWDFPRRCIVTPTIHNCHDANKKKILRKCTAGYKLSRSQEKINHLMYLDDIKLFAKN